MDRFFTYLYPLIEEVFGRLGVTDPSARPVLVVLSDDTIRVYPWQAAMECALYSLGVLKLSIKDGLAMVFTVIPQCTDVLIVPVPRMNSFTLAQASGYPLPSTQQVIPVGYRQVVTKDPDLLETQWNDKMSANFLHPTHASSLVVAILRTLQACPRDARPRIVENIVFSGEGVLFMPSLPQRVMRQVKAVLQKDKVSIVQPELPMGPTDSLVSTMPMANWEQLEPLASKITGLIELPYRSDLLVWVGASLWSKGWHQRDPESPVFGYTIPKPFPSNDIIEA